MKKKCHLYEIMSYWYGTRAPLCQLSELEMSLDVDVVVVVVVVGGWKRGGKGNLCNVELYEYGADYLNFLNSDMPL